MVHNFFLNISVPKVVASVCLASLITTSIAVSNDPFRGKSPQPFYDEQGRVVPGWWRQDLPDDKGQIAVNPVRKPNGDTAYLMIDDAGVMVYDSGGSSKDLYLVRTLASLTIAAASGRCINPLTNRHGIFAPALHAGACCY